MDDDDSVLCAMSPMDTGSSHNDAPWKSSSLIPSYSLRVAMDHEGTLWQADSVTKERDSEFKGWICPLCQNKMCWTNSYCRANGTKVCSFFRHVNIHSVDIAFQRQHSPESLQHLYTKDHIVRNLSSITFMASLCKTEQDLSS